MNEEHMMKEATEWSVNIMAVRPMKS